MKTLYLVLKNISNKESNRSRIRKFKFCILAFSLSLIQRYLLGVKKNDNIWNLKQIMSLPEAGLPGTWPANLFWSADNKQVYFYWNPDGSKYPDLYLVGRNETEPGKLESEEFRELTALTGSFNREKTLEVYEKKGESLSLCQEQRYD
jgi:hypothetical protein